MLSAPLLMLPLRICERGRGLIRRESVLVGGYEPLLKYQYGTTVIHILRVRLLLLNLR